MKYNSQTNGGTVSIKIALNTLNGELKQLERLKHVNAVIASIRSLNGHLPRGGKRGISETGRARIAAEQRARWVKVKVKKK